jgi:hypothetical protein
MRVPVVDIGSPYGTAFYASVRSGGWSARENPATGGKPVEYSNPINSRAMLL